MKKIALIIHKLSGGGAERAACNLSLALADRYDTTLIAFDARNATYPHTENTIDMRLPMLRQRYLRWTNLPRRSLRMAKIKREKKFDVSVAFLMSPGLVNVFSKRPGEKTIMSIRNYLSIDKGSSPDAKKTVLAANKSDLIVPVSRAAGLDLVKNYGVDEKKIRVVYNSVDAELLSGAAKGAAIPEEIEKWMAGRRGVCVTMGRLHDQKAQWQLIRAMSEVVKTVPDAGLMILGEGPYAAKLGQLAKDMGVSDNILMPGYVKAPHACVAKCDLFVLSSVYEGMPNAMLEAMACGLPVVSADCLSGPREILAPDTDIEKSCKGVERAEYGILTQVEDPKKGFIGADVPLDEAEKALAEAIILMLTDDALRRDYAAKALERMKDFTPEKITVDWANVIDELI